MRTFGILLLIGVLGMPLVATAEEAAQQTSQDRVRSAGRTWGGVALLAGGGTMAAYYGASTCSKDRFLGELFDVRPCGEAVTLIWTGIGVATVGALLATVWSDVPVMRNMTVAPRRGGVQVGASFGF